LFWLIAFAPCVVARFCFAGPAMGVADTAHLTVRRWREKSSGELPAEPSSKLHGADKTTLIGSWTTGAGFEHRFSLPQARA
jgi:hypothetical protein